MHQCDYCGQNFSKLFYDQRFCNRRCSEAFHVAERKEAIEHFRAAAESSVARVAHTLQPDEALIVDNHIMLHARSHFADPDRHLIRVRMHAAA